VAISEDETRFKCVFYPTLACPVRKEMNEVMMTTKFKNKRYDDAEVPAEVLRTVMETLYSSFMALPSFCHICPFKYQEDLKIHKPIDIPGGVIKVEEEKV